MDIKPGSFQINGVVVFGAGTLQVSHVGDVPPDRQEVLALAATVTRRVAESAHSECLAGLREIKARADASESGLGDMGPPPAECGALAEELDTLYKLETRIEALKEYVIARRAVCEQRADKHLRDAYSEATRRVERGLLAADAYLSVGKYCESHGASVSAGRTRAARIRSAERPAAPANDAATPAARTGTDR